jgi:hypothetical protein
VESEALDIAKAQRVRCDRSNGLRPERDLMVDQEDQVVVSHLWPTGIGTSRALPIFCFRNGRVNCSTQFLKKKSFALTAMVGRERPIADIYQIAKNCRTSVEMIEKYYAAHLKTKLDAAAINIMRPRPKNKTTSKKGPGRVEVSPLAAEM